MRLTRLYHPASLQAQLVLSAEASHHLSRVLRCAVGDECIVFDGKGNEARYQIHSIEKKQVVVNQVEVLSNQVESAIHIHLQQALMKGDKMDFVLQKAVELGVSEITPMQTTRSDVRLDEKRLAKKMAHWQGVVVSACEQSGRAVVPRLNQLSAGITAPDGEGAVKMLFHPAATKSLSQAPKASRYVIAIGPEGGFSNEELVQAQADGYELYSLGKRVLRAETAPLAAVAILQGQFDH